jgi:hypothetical protein
VVGINIAFVQMHRRLLALLLLILLGAYMTVATLQKGCGKAVQLFPKLSWTALVMALTVSIL